MWFSNGTMDDDVQIRPSPDGTFVMYSCCSSEIWNSWASAYLSSNACVKISAKSDVLRIVFPCGEFKRSDTF